MTDSTEDWADEVAKGFVPSHGPPSLVHCHYDRIAKALRAAELRGRAMGMREAAELCGNDDFYPDHDRWFLAHRLEAAASLQEVLQKQKNNIT